MLDTRQDILVLRQPGNGPNGGRDEQEAIAQAIVATEEMAGKLGGDGYAGKIVVGKTGMAAMDRDQDLARLSAGDRELAIAEGTWGEAAVDADPVPRVAHRLPEAVRKAEAPLLGIVCRAVGHQIGLVG